MSKLERYPLLDGLAGVPEVNKNEIQSGEVHSSISDVSGKIIQVIDNAVENESGVFGKIFFTLPVVGQGGEIFKSVKLRTLKGGNHIASDEKGGARPSDKRIGMYGKVVRGLYINEATQFLNILAGEMDFVGQRPVPASELVTLKGLRFLKDEQNKGINLKSLDLDVFGFGGLNLENFINENFDFTELDLDWIDDYFRLLYEFKPGLMGIHHFQDESDPDVFKNNLASYRFLQARKTLEAKTPDEIKEFNRMVVDASVRNMKDSLLLTLKGVRTQ